HAAGTSGALRSQAGEVVESERCRRRLSRQYAKLGVLRRPARHAVHSLFGLHVGRWAWNSAGGHWERRTRHVVDKRWKGVVAARLQGHAPGSNHGTPLFHVSAVGGFREQSRDLAPVQRRLRFDGYGDCVPRTTRLRALPYERRSRETK